MRILPFRLCTLCLGSRRAFSTSGRKLTEWEPDYLEKMKPPVPEYSPINVQIRGYDYPVLEAFESYVHRLAVNFSVSVSDGWATPGQKLSIDVIKETKKSDEFNLMVYERNLQLTRIPSSRAGLLFSLIRRTLPPGVELSIHEHQSQFDEVRLVPDLELLDLKTQLDEMQKPKS